MSYGPRKSVFPRVNAEAHDGLRSPNDFRGLEPVQALNDTKRMRVRPHQDSSYSPSVRILCAISSTRFRSSMALRLTGA